jgi:pimeloyl-ACP methyl ester carboxylesterase
MVPRDPEDPSLGSIAMALDRHPASGHSLGALLTNPGGPGESGVDALPGFVQQMPAAVLSDFDVVGFDPPGVGRTAPIVCLGNAQLGAYYHADPAPTTAAGLAQLIAEARSFARGCEEHSGAELPYVSTVDAAMDMEVLRKDLGEAKLDYLGFSYGTFLGATYAGLYPTHIRAMVLDGALDPDLPYLAQVDIQAAGLERQLHQFIATCTSDPSCPWKPGPDPEVQIESMIARTRTSPLPVSGSTRTVGPSEALYGTLWPLYFTTTWPDLEATLAEASHGDGTDLMEEFDSYVGRTANGTYNNIFEANAAVNCLDQPPPTIGQIEAAAPAAEKASPVFGLADLYGEIQCAVWPVAATGKVAPIHAPGAPPIVVVGSTDDPITPYAWAQALAHQLDSGVLLTRQGYGHTAYFVSSCIQRYVDAYLIDLVTPPRGTICPSN